MFHPLVTRGLRWLAWLLIAICIALGVYFAATWSRLPSLPGKSVLDDGAPDWAPAPAITSTAWQVFVRSAAGPADRSGPAAKRFRLAGTFFTYAEGESAPAANRRAILDDLEKSGQYLVAEGQDIDGYLVARIAQDHVILRQGGIDTELRLSFGGEGQGAETSVAGGEAVAEPVLERTPFGDRVGTNRWVITRDGLLGYYRELVDDPERIAALYMSLKPDYRADNTIGGYLLDVEGEGEFFRAMGLEQGDVIRKVNSMNMTSQKRAEYFIGEFVKNRVNAFVLDIERGGKTEKLIYMIR
ncbi:MAG TPA: hypothetical protein VIH35_09785 [Kiritimatiellia bacterium]|jgi:type II secretory pathway component PulC